MTTNNGRSSKAVRRGLRSGLAAALLLGCSPVALHAETSNAELAKEIAELKAQIHAMRGAIAENRSETRRTTAKVRAVAERAPIPVATAPLPDGATPVFVTANKQMQFGSLTITPGGFVETVGMFRSRNTQSDIITSFGAIPYNNNNLAHLGESRVSGRQSRVALLVESPISSSMLVAGYGEFDFLAAGVNANNTQVFSYNPRIRHLYTTLDNEDYGLHVLAGQTWSLLTTNSKGITPRNEVIVPAIDGGFIPGFNYGRIPQIRVVKDFGKKLWIAVSAEAPGTSFNGCNNVINNANAAPAAGAATTSIPSNGVSNVTCLAVGQGAYGGAGLQQQYALNRMPDFQAKIAYEANIADRDIHLEATGIYRNLYDYVNYGTLTAAGYPSSSSQSTDAYAVAANLIVPVIPKKLDLVAGGLIGKGMGRYTSSALPDATIDGNGNVKAIPIFTAIAGLTYHVTPAIDVYLYSGIDSVGRAYSRNTNGSQSGYGQVVGVDNSGCNTIGSTNCSAQTHQIWQITAGMWDKIYKGNFGEVRVGVQYSYTQREGFSQQLTTTSARITPRAEDHILMTSLRYYPFQ